MKFISSHHRCRRDFHNRLRFESLEERLALATHIWNGAFSNLWSNRSNWIGGSPAGDPQAILSFPSAAANFTSQNDLAELTVAEISFAGGNYALGGNTIELVPGPLGFPRVHMDATGKNNSLALFLSRAATNIDISLDIAAGSTLTVTGVISGGAAATNIVKSGPGTLILGGANTFADGVLITGGVLQIENSSALGMPIAGDANRTTVSGGTLSLVGNLNVSDSFLVGAAGGTLRTSGNITWRGEVFLDSTDLNVNVGGTLTISGQISDNPAGPSRGLIKEGTGKLVLTSANTYRRFTDIRAGTLSINNASALGTTDGGTFLSGFSSALELQGSITVVGESLFLTSGSLVGVDGDNAWQGPVTLSGSREIGVLAGTLTISGVIGGSGGFVGSSAAASKLVLTNANTYTGQTAVRGILNIQNPLALGLSASIGVSGTLELQLQGTNIFNMPLGLGDSGAFRNVSGTNTWTGTITTNKNTGKIDVRGGQLTISGLIKENGSVFSHGGFTKAGDGSLSVTANSTYIGETVIIAGSLFVNGTIPTKVVVNGGTLGGVGTVAAITANGGVVNPGVGIGRLTANVAGGTGVSFGPAATFTVSLSGTASGTGYDQLRVLSSSLNLGGAALRASLNFIPLSGTSFTIIDNATTLPVTGAFAGLPEGATIPTVFGSLRLTYKGGTGNDVVLVYSALNTASRFPDRSVTPVIDEGDVATLTGTISDPDLHDVFFLDVNWGDGTPTEKHVFPPGSNGKLVQLTHRYLDDELIGTPQDDYHIQLAWHDKAGEGSSATLTTTVRNVAPVVAAVPNIPLSPSGVLNQLVTFIDPGRDKWTATVDYGDGDGPQPVDVQAGKQLLLHHRYQQPGTYLVRVVVTDDDGGVGKTSFRVRWDDRLNPSLVDAFFEWLDDYEHSTTFSWPALPPPAYSTRPSGS